MELAIEAMELAFSDDREVPVRSAVGGVLFMPGRVGPHLGLKSVSTVPGNPAGIVVLFAPDGSPVGIVDGPTLTAIRTGAAAGLATRLMSPPEARVLALLGAGAMAADQVAAIRAVRTIERLLIWSRNPDRAREKAKELGGEAVADPRTAVSQADVISTVTPSASPLFGDSDLVANVHINAMGAFTPAMVEVPSDTVRRSLVVVDDLEAAAAEAGDLLQAGRVADGTISDLLSGRLSVSGGRPTLFKSVGIASQDVAAAAAALGVLRR
ncbi:MAG TPA: ornithine cyclodeaminase [Acidimicrobiia bacterium]